MQHIPDADPWTTIRQMIPTPARRRVGRIVHRHAPLLAALFYRRMLADPQLSPLLDHDVVNQRLNASLVAWLRRLFDTDTPPQELDRTQRRVGEAHARIGVSHMHVAGAGRVLKRAIAERLHADRGIDDTAGALQYVYELVDFAIDSMTDSMSTATTRLTRSDESYRLYSLTQNLRAERERQRTHLVEWVQELLVKHYWEEVRPGAPQAASASHFELWVEHKARVMFEQDVEFQLLRERMHRVTQTLLPQLRQVRDEPARARAVVAALHEEAGAMKQLLSTLFDRANAADDGRDATTRLLNRRYLPSIVKREIGMTQAGGHPFSLLLLDIDRFAEIASLLGAAATDTALARVADALSDGVRASDFVFRVGDEQFAVLLVDSDRSAAADVAEALRQALEQLVLRSTGELAPQLTASIGVATFEGHPDYEHLLRRAEAALAQARQQGGNRAALAPRDA